MSKVNSDEIIIRLSDKGILLMFLAGVNIVTDLTLGNLLNLYLQHDRTLVFLLIAIFNIFLISLSIRISENEVRFFGDKTLLVGKALTALVFMGMTIVNLLSPNQTIGIAIALLILGNSTFIIILLGLNMEK